MEAQGLYASTPGEVACVANAAYGVVAVKRTSHMPVNRSTTTRRRAARRYNGIQGAAGMVKANKARKTGRYRKKGMLYREICMAAV